MTDTGAADSPRTDPATPGRLRVGRTEPLDRAEADRLFREGVALFNGARYWHAHERWETLWRAAPDDQRDFYQGLIQLAAGLLHVQRRNLRGAQAQLSKGLTRLRPYMPSHRGVFVNELAGTATRLLETLNDGVVPHLIPPIIRFTDFEEPDFSR